MTNPAAGHAGHLAAAAGHTPGAGARRRRQIVLSVAAAVLGPVLILTMSAWISWRQTWREAETEMLRTADAAAEYARRVFDGLVLRLDRANEVLAGLSDEEIRAREASLHAALRRIAERTGDAGAIYLFVYDRHAYPLVTGNLYPAPREQSFLDRSFNQVLRGTGAPDTHVSPIYVGRVTREPYFTLTRRREGTGNGLPPGSYDGVINASVLAVDAGAALRALAGAPEDRLALARAEGDVLVRTSGPGQAEQPQRLGVANPLLPRLRSGEERGLAVVTPEDGGARRISAFRRVQGYPVYATAERPTDAVWSRWQRGIALNLAIGVPAILSLGLLAAALVRRQQALEAANLSLEARVAQRTAELERRSREAADLTGALELTPALLRGAEGTILFWSQGSERLYGHPARLAVGQRSHALLGTEPVAPATLAAALAELETCGEWRGEVRQRHRDGRTLIVLAHWVLRRGADGAHATVVEVNTDISALRRVETEREEARALLGAALDAADMGTWQYDLASGRLEMSDGADRLFGLPPAGPALRRPLAEYLAAVHPADRRQMQQDIELAAAIGRDMASEYRLLRPDGSVRWIAWRGGFRMLGDRSLRFMGALVDVTAIKLAQEALAGSEARLRLAQEAGGIGTWEWATDGGAIHWSRETAALFGLDAEQDVPLGYRATLARIHPADRGAVIASLRQALRGDGQFAAEFRALRPAGPGLPEPEVRWAVARGRRLSEAGGSGTRLIGVVMDITDRKRAEERQVLLMREVDHRAKNALAVVQAALRLTPKHDAAAYAAAVEGRVRALARAHTLLATDKWSGSMLRDLLEGELAPFLDSAGGAGPRARLEGPPLRLSPRIAQALGMAIHELATNATKYGALSVPGGCVTVAWTVPQPGRMRLRWVERGGPPVAHAPARSGFGSRVIEASIAGQLGGTVERSWEPEGLSCTLAVPLDGASSAA